MDFNKLENYVNSIIKNNNVGCPVYVSHNNSNIITIINTKTLPKPITNPTQLIISNVNFIEVKKPEEYINIASVYTYYDVVLDELYFDTDSNNTKNIMISDDFIDLNIFGPSDHFFVSLERAYYQSTNRVIHTGKYKSWHSDGLLYSVGNYFKGKKNGFWTFWMNGKVYSKGNYLDDKEVGTWYFYDNCGRLTKEEKYLNKQYMILKHWSNHKPLTLLLENGKIKNFNYVEKCNLIYEKYITNAHAFTSVEKFYIVIFEVYQNNIIPVVIFNKFNPLETFTNADVIKINKPEQLGRFTLYSGKGAIEKAFYYGLYNWNLYDGVYKQWDANNKLCILLE